MPKVPCWHCGTLMASASAAASCVFVDGTTASDLNATDIIRLACPEVHRHGPRAPSSRWLHPTCKRALVGVRNALSAELPPSEPPVTRSMPLQSPAEPVHRPAAARSERL